MIWIFSICLLIISCNCTKADGVLYDPSKLYAPLKHPHLCLHLELDFGHNLPEVHCKLSKQHFKSFPNSILFHIHSSQLGHVCFYWSEDVGGKGVNETLTCLWIFLCTFLCGAGGLTLSSDMCGHVWSEPVLQFLCWLCHPKNAKRILDWFKFTSYEPGHSVNASDHGSLKVDNAIKKRGTIPILCRENLWEYLDENCIDVRFIEVKEIWDFTKMMNKSKIFCKINNGMDIVTGTQFGTNICRPISAYYGIFREFDAKVGDYVRYENYDLIVFRCHEDREAPMKKVHLWPKSYRNQKKNLKDPFALNLKQKPKGIEAAKIQAQQNLIIASYGGREDLLELTDAKHRQGKLLQKVVSDEKLQRDQSSHGRQKTGLAVALRYAQLIRHEKLLEQGNLFEIEELTECLEEYEEDITKYFYMSKAEWCSIIDRHTIDNKSRVKLLPKLECVETVLDHMISEHGMLEVSKKIIMRNVSTELQTRYAAGVGKVPKKKGKKSRKSRLGNLRR